MLRPHGAKREPFIRDVEANRKFKKFHSEIYLKDKILVCENKFNKAANLKILNERNFNIRFQI